MKIGHKPQQGTSDRYGNNECFHDNYTGSVVSLDVPMNSNGDIIVGDHTYNDTLILPNHTKYTIHPWWTQDEITIDVSISGMDIMLDYHLTARFDPETIWFKRWHRYCMQIVYMDGHDTIRYRVTQNYTSAYSGNEPSCPVIQDYSEWFLVDASDKSIKSNLIDPAHLMATLDAFLDYSQPYYDDRLIWGRLSQDACDNAKALSQNLCATVIDAKEIPALLKTIKDLLAKKVTPKTIANAYLVYKYAIAPSISDGQEIYSAISGPGNKKRLDAYFVRSRSNFVSTDISGNNWNTSFNLKCYYLQENDAFAAIFQNMFSWGIGSLENVWDFIPFSFVVDWFWSFGDMLAAQDTRTFISTLPVTSVMQTRCDVTTINSSKLPYGRNMKLFGNITIKRYRRCLSTRLLPPYVELSKPTNPLDHVVEGGALLIQCSKR